MTPDQIFQDLKNIMAKLLKITVTEINELATMESDLSEIGIDSVESLDLLHELEDHFSIKIPDSEASSLVKVADVVQLVLDKQSG